MIRLGARLEEDLYHLRVTTLKRAHCREAQLKPTHSSNAVRSLLWSDPVATRCRGQNGSNFGFLIHC